uniref:U-box domain-containing protein 19 n=1 Tax=Erigeron canadensis TaxID=72917 RepID=UPI001CB9D2CC|nr:U-box domain-containing protein 19 [Erigeron canadensis]
MCDTNARRVLTFPAIRPCESVSPATLLSSLITLAKNICSYKSRHIFTNASNAKHSFRLVGNILVFLEDIRQYETSLSYEMVLSLSELHFVFQKLRFLLEDCTRSDARVWMLTRSEKVSYQFRAIFRSVSVALDVLPLDSLNISYELKELMGFIKQQALNSKLGFRPEDERVLELLRSVLDQLEQQMNPNLKRVLEYLGIRSWTQCNNEIKFLDSEIGLERSTPKKSDLGILSSLMGLMTYSRCRVFTVINDEENPASSDGFRRSNHLISSMNVDDFRCPISLEIMSDPVTLTTGHTYDRASIEKWFKSGNLTCPKTGEKVNSGSLVSNLCIRSIIKQYCVEKGILLGESVGGNRSREIAHANTGGSVAAEAAIKMAVDFLVDRLVFGTTDAKHKATYEIRLLSKTSIFNRACLVEAGVIPCLLDLICVKNPKIQENAIAALLNLSKYPKSKKVLVENGGLELILEVAQNGMKMEARQHAAGTLFYLASVDEYRDIIGKIPRSIPVLMELVLEGTNRCKKNALVAILGLLMYPENHWKALAAGVVPLLVDLLRSSSQCEDLLVDSLAILATLAEKPDGTMSILSCGALHVILDVVGSTTSKASKEYCVALLLAMCTNGGADVVRVLVSNPSLMGPLYSLLAEGGSRASKKASSLIRIIHEFNEKHASSTTRRPVDHFQEQFVNVW